ncbi:LOW QUALITY PROTEIN: glutamate-rich protein 6 [Strix uralensis]|uniref:LOW QUALITY PROTEIN: glutamate-rich protein 6 n=1 Tax=Strix uralensis TaxID=36305 RepID=UPI003DA61BBF
MDGARRCGPGAGPRVLRPRRGAGREGPGRTAQRGFSSRIPSRCRGRAPPPSAFRRESGRVGSAGCGQARGRGGASAGGSCLRLRRAPGTAHTGRRAAARKAPSAPVREAETSGSIEAIAARELPGLWVSMQTGASGLHRHAYGEPTLSEEFSSLDVLCDMEFEEDFVKLFKKSLYTVPSVGLPTLLAHRPKSSRENLQIEAEEGCAPRCEYCGSLLRPFPPLEDPRPPPQDYASVSWWEVSRGVLWKGPLLWHRSSAFQKFCCEHNRDLYKFIVSERKGREGAGSVPVAVSPQEPHGTDRLSKGTVYQRQRERRVARQLAFLAAEPTAAAEYSHQAGTISYLLSQEPPSPAGRTLVPAESVAEPEEEPEEEPVTCCDFSPAGGKVVKNGLLEKYYKHGGKFLTMLPDGTAQLFYPSGNLAITVVREKARVTCVVQEDELRNAAVRAVFTSTGRSTCYYPDGAVWINLNVEGGQYLDRAGSRVRHWTWPNRVVASGPPVPLRPVFIALNRHVGVRILGQDKVTVSFLAMGQQAKLNVGTKVQVLPKCTGGSARSRSPQRARGSQGSSRLWRSTAHPAVGAPCVAPRSCPVQPQPPSPVSRQFLQAAVALHSPSLSQQRSSLPAQCR